MQIDLIVAPDSPPDKVTELSQLAEGYGFGGVWTSNMHYSRDPFLNFVDAARGTSRITFGPVAVSPFELHPMKMGNALLTLNEMIGGRAGIGIAAGDGGAPVAMGVKAERRVRAVRECVEILEAMCTGKPVQYDGEIYKCHWYEAAWLTQPSPSIYVCAGGPQMLRSAAKYAQGIFLGDHLPEHVAEVRETIDPHIAEANPNRDSFRLLNFWAWHVKEDPEEALAESRMWMAARGTPWPSFYHGGILDDDEMQVVFDNNDALFQAFYAQSSDIPEIPRSILDKLCHRCTSASPISELDREIERLRQFRDAGLTNLCLRVYENPADAIRVIGEQVIPALD